MSATSSWSSRGSRRSSPPKLFVMRSDPIRRWAAADWARRRPLIFVALDLRMAIALALSFVAGRLGNVRAEPGAVRGADLKAVR